MTPLPIEQQVVNRELSEQLRDLGVPQDSVWWWENHELKFKDIFPEAKWRLTMQKSLYDKLDYISAFTVAELINTLGGEITIPNNTKNVADFIALKVIDKISDLKKLIQNNLLDVRKI